MKKGRVLKEYDDGVQFFLKFMVEHGIYPSMMACPCINGGNFRKMKDVEVKNHLYVNEIYISYEKWIQCREPSSSIGVSCKIARIQKLVCDEEEDDCLTNVVNDVEDYFVDQPNELSKMLEEAEKAIYPSSKITKLSFFQ